MTVNEYAPIRPHEPVALDLYRDIHKGIRAELFAVTASAANVDPSDPCGRADLAAYVRDVATFLVSHAEHEDAAIQPALETHLPRLAAQVEEEHAVLERRIDDLRALADIAAADNDGPRTSVHQLYCELASFTGAYLAHQDVEERVIMPGLEAAIGVEAVGAIHAAIISSIPPAEMARSLAIMVPAMNLDDRTDMLGGMRAGAPPEAFSGLWSITRSVLPERDFAALAARLDLQ